MQKITSKLALCLALTLALSACKDDAKKESKEQAQEQSKEQAQEQSKEQAQEQPKEDKDKPTGPKLPQIGARCWANDYPQCDGKDIMYCDYQHTDEGIAISSTWKKEACGKGMECRHIEDGSASGVAACVASAKLFTSCEAALADFWAEIDASSDAVAFCKSLNNAFPEETIYDSRAPKCLDAGDGKKIIMQFNNEYCNTCSRQGNTITCAQNDALLGKNAKENDVCWPDSFVPRYVENNSVLVCTGTEGLDEYDRVKKLTCPAGREIALVEMRLAVCIDPQEAECTAHTYKCGSVPSAAASLGDKICLQTDKGNHLLAKEDILGGLVSSFYDIPIICGAKGCDQATGTCLEAGSSDFKWCKAGQFGDACETCTCKNGQCDDGLDGDGECISCDKDYFGKNCDKTYHGTMTDSKNKKYNTVLINNVEWMAENLATDTATDGSPVTCFANPKGGSDFVAKYGCLYSGVEAKKVCPKGWHLPSNAEFGALLAYVGNTNSNDLLSITWNQSLESSLELTDEYGFGALPAGECFESFCDGDAAIFWGNSIDDPSSCYSLKLEPHSIFVAQNICNPANYKSVRCIKD